MVEGNWSRRSVVGALAGTAAVGSAAAIGRRMFTPAAVGGDRIRVAPGSADFAFRPAAHELRRWRAAVGRTIWITGETGRVEATVESVTPLHAGPRPARVRRAPFLVRLTTADQGAPAGDRIYALDAPIAGLGDLFLTRGDDAAGKAMLLAVFG